MVAPDDICMLRPKFIENIIDFQIEIKIFSRFIIEAQIINSVFIVRPPFQITVCRVLSPDKIESVQTTGELLIMINHVKGQFILRRISERKIIPGNIGVQMRPSYIGAPFTPDLRNQLGIPSS